MKNRFSEPKISASKGCGVSAFLSPRVAVLNYFK